MHAHRIRGHRTDADPLAAGRDQDLDRLLTLVARGDQTAFEDLYDQVAGRVYGLIRKVVRDPAQSEEVAQEVLLEIWRTAPRFDPSRGRAATWMMTIAHRRAIDRVRSEAAAAEREHKAPRCWTPRSALSKPVSATASSGCATAWG